MGVNLAYAGRVYPPTAPYVVGREHLRDFAVAVGATHPAHHDVDAARALGHPDVVATPTFAVVIAQRAEAQLIEDLLTAAVTLTGQFSVALKQTELTDVMRRAVEAITPTAEARGVQLQVDLGRAPLPIAADEIRLRQALWNVMANAVKFTPAGGRVQIRVRRGDRGHVIQVVDDGPGIDPDLMPTIFDAFVRSTQNNERGLGLGLAIARQIIDKHGGRIAVTASPDNGGSLFTVDLPAPA